MKRLIVASAFIVSVPVAAQAQDDIRYRAEIDEQGEVTLVPEDSPSLPDVATEVLGPTPYVSEIFVVKDENEAVKGVFTDRASAAAAVVAPGDTLEVLDVSPAYVDATASTDQGYLEGVVREAARILINEAKESACAFDPKPETITPSVEISLGFGTGGTFSVSATWNTETLCPE